MKDKQLYLYWLYLAILSAALGFMQDRNNLVILLLAVLMILFYVPGAMLLYRGIQRGDRKPLRRVALLSLISLVVTTVFFIANYMTVLAPNNRLLGNILHAVLVIVSVPMMCSPLPALSLFLWACLLFTAISYWKKTEDKK
jgi:ammonia channel protein AmtB